VLLALLVVRLVLGFWAAHELENTVERIAPHYGGLALATLAPPNLPRVENRAKVLAAAAALVNTPGNAAGEGRLNSALTGSLAKDLATQIPILREIAADNRLALEVVATAEGRAQSNWEIHYSDGRSVRLPSLMELRTLSNVVEAAGRVALHDGQADEAVRHARLGFVLAAGMAPERQLLMQLIRVAIDQAHFGFIKTILTDGRPSAPALATLAPQFDTALTRSPGVLGLVGEVKFLNSVISDVEDGKQQGRWDGPAYTYVLGSGFLWMARPAVFAGHARALDQLHRTVQFARLQPFERQARKLPLPSADPPWWWKRFANFVWGGFGQVIASSDRHLALARIASTAVALRRHKLEHGSYPASLDPLVPGFLAEVPIDPFTGRPLRYLADGDGFSLRAEVPPGTSKPERFVWRIPR
jgi:hypothetical protein